MVKPKGKLRGVLVLLLLAALVLWVLWTNSAPETTHYTVSDPRIPQAFTGYRIAQISDLHSQEFGPKEKSILSQLKAAKPDIIVFTGDLLNSYDPQVKAALEFVRAAVQIAPCYFVSGNHELRLAEEYAQLKTGMLEAGVLLLQDQRVELSREGASLWLVGLSDRYKLSTGEVQAFVPQEGYSIVLSHRPEFAEAYRQANCGLVLTGHTHGGQLRLPFIGAVYAPGLGYFPKYASGMHKLDGTALIISRGLGNSSVPIRFCNRPELVIVTLQPQDA